MKLTEKEKQIISSALRISKCGSCELRTMCSLQMNCEIAKLIKRLKK